MQYATFGLMSQAHIWLLCLDIKIKGTKSASSQPWRQSKQSPYESC